MQYLARLERLARKQEERHPMSSIYRRPLSEMEQRAQQDWYPRLSAVIAGHLAPTGDAARDSTLSPRQQRALTRYRNQYRTMQVRIKRGEYTPC